MCVSKWVILHVNKPQGYKLYRNDKCILKESKNVETSLVNKNNKSKRTNMNFWEIKYYQI